jgi:hypothetical protein
MEIKNFSFGPPLKLKNIRQKYKKIAILTAFLKRNLGHSSKNCLLNTTPKNFEKFKSYEVVRSSHANPPNNHFINN